MEEEKEITTRGRGFSMIQAFKRAQNQPGSSQDSGDALPKPRGRAGLLQTLRKMKELQIGSNGDAKPERPQDKSAAPDSPNRERSPPRSFIGQSGKSVPASANYIRLKLEPGRGVFEYEVRFDPMVDAKSARYKMLSQVIVQYSKSKTFDGHKLYLPLHVFDRQHFLVPHPYDDSEINMTIVYKKQMRMDECIHLYNVLFKRIMHILTFKRVGRQFFDNKRPIPIPQHKLEIWPGYVTAVNEFSGGIMLCLDVQHRVLRTQNALSFMYDVMKSETGRAKDVIAKGLIGSCVLTRYNNQTYIVHDIMWDISPTGSFETDNGPVKFTDYYRRQYNIDIQDLKQPLLIHRTKMRVPGSTEKVDQMVMLVPELCYMTGLTDAMRADMRVMKDIAQFTRVTPNQRMNSLRKYVRNVQQNAEAGDVLTSWGLEIDAATIDLNMRILEPETIVFGGDVKIHGTEQADWTSAALRNRVISAIDVENWLLIYTPQDVRLAKDFVEHFVRLANRMGIVVNPPKRFQMPDDRTETYLRVLKEKIEEQLQIIVVICPTSRDDRYMAIKKTCCVGSPMPSQVINARTLKNPTKLPAITQKIALQMNCKLGGTLWSVKFPFKAWMICGIDVYHSAGMADSVCGLVCSINESITRWYSTCCFHDAAKELGNYLKPMFVKALMEYRAANSFFPSTIVIYRDGVGDGQLKTCSGIEVEQLRSLLVEMGLPDVKLIFIVVQKRIMTRIFDTRNGDAGNPPPGSVVDQEVTRRNFQDFFLVSQHVRQGTVSPTHYIVLYNSSQIKPDNVQRLSYKLCHMYYNWTGTVRVPAPCQYAHKLASLVGQVLRRPHAEKLSTRLFYL